MIDIADDIVRRLLRRQPTAEDYKRINVFMDHLPPEMRSSPGAIAEIVLRMEGIREFEAILQRASSDAQNRIHHELPERVEKAAERAFNHIRDKLPIDASDRFGRLLKYGSVCAVVIAAIGAAAGWTASNIATARYQMSHQAASELAFSRCVEAAAGAAVQTVDRHGDNIRYNGAVFVTLSRNCAAEYADRRAGGK